MNKLVLAFLVVSFSSCQTFGEDGSFDPVSYSYRQLSDYVKSTGYKSKIKREPRTWNRGRGR